MPTVEQIETIASDVVSTLQRAKLSAEPGAFSWMVGGLDRRYADEAALKNISDWLDAARLWQARGIAAAQSGELPGAAGWAGWQQRGQIWMDGAAEQLDSTRVLLPAIVETVKAAPGNLTGDLQAGAELAGSGVSAVAGGFLKNAWWVVALVAAGGVGWLVFQSRVLKP